MKKSTIVLSLMFAANVGLAVPTVPTIDISADAARQVVIAEGATDRYEGHPTTLLADDGKTMFCVWTTGHGGPCGQMARSDDGGLTWTRLDATLPAVYARTHRNCPTLQKLCGPDGKTRYFIYSAKAKEGRGLGIMMSDDLGQSWQELPCQPQLSAGMPPTGVMTLKDGTIALFGQVFKDKNKKKDRPTDDQAVWMAISTDGGRSYGKMRVVMQAESRNLCEPCCLRSPDGKSLVLLARENRHQGRSMMAFSHDEGATWSAPVDTPWALTGDRHEGVLLPDGRYIIAFRDQAIGSTTKGQFVAWVGTYDDLQTGREGQYRIRLLNHHFIKTFPGGFGDTGYPGVELLPDGTIVCTTYSRHFADNRQSSVVSTRFKISEIDRLAANNGGRKAAMEVLPLGSVRAEGRLREQLEKQAKGLTGHAEELYDDIGQSDWLTGAKRGGNDQGRYQFSLPAVLKRSMPRAKNSDRGWIQKAIDEAAARGGGKVVVPAGVHNVGTIWLKSHIELHLKKGAVLNASVRHEDYDQFPRLQCPITPEFSDKALICAAGAEDIAITGEGTIDGNGPAFYDTTRYVNNGNQFWRVPDLPRPRLLQMVNCKRVKIEGVTFRDAAAFTMYVRNCEDFDVGHIAIIGDRRITNNDGIDVDGCRRVRIGDSVFNTGDDCIALRAIRTRTAPDREVVCENVVVSNCALSGACQAIRIGCPSDDTIRNVIFRNIDMTGSRNGIYFGNHLYCVREVDEGFFQAQDIVFEGIRGKVTGNPIQILVDDGIKLRKLDGIYFRDMDVSGEKPRFTTTKFTPYGRVEFNGVKVNGKACKEGQVEIDVISNAPFVRKPSLTWDNLN